MLKNVGPINAKKILDHYGEASSFFKERPAALKAARIPERITSQLQDAHLLRQADRELEFIERNQVTALSIRDEGYPYRLKQCEDAPIVLYTKGPIDLNRKRIISVVGTREASAERLAFTEQLIHDLAPYQVVIISGLAYGIDTKAHQSAVNHGVSTGAVLAHGFNRIYPYRNRSLANKMLENGGWISDFPSSAPLNPGNFPARNRIVAGLADATIVIESAYKGGSLITADIAHSYHREVLAVPGPPNRASTRGCNHLIKTNKAGLIESASDVAHVMGWEAPGKSETKQEPLFVELNLHQQTIVRVLGQHGHLKLEQICEHGGLKLHNSVDQLLDLEFKQIVKSVPGNKYALCS